MKQIWIILFMLALAQASFGQPPDTLWTRTYGGSSDEEAYSVQQTADGGYIVAGATQSYGAGNLDFYIVKTDASGDTQWTRTQGGSSCHDIAYSVQQTTDGGYVAAGWTCSFGAGYADFYLVKTDGSGNILWTRTYGDVWQDIAYSVQQTTDGGYVVAGSTHHYGGGNDFYLVKTNSSGDPLWTRAYWGPGSWTVAYSVQQTTDGGYILAGCTDGDFYLVKTYSEGGLCWTRTYGGSGGDCAYSVQQTADGGYVVAGYTDSFGAGDYDFYLVKTNSQGDTLWTRTYGGALADEAYSIQQTTDGGYVVAGTSMSFGAGSSDFWLVRTDANGDSLWSRTFGGTSGDECHSVQQTSDGGYVLAGITSSFGFGGDFWLVKTGPEYPNVSYVTLILPGPPDWGYRLHRVSGALSRLVFTDFCSGTVGWMSGDAPAAGWTATNYADSVVFTNDTWLATGSIDTLWLSHPYCSDYVTWTVGDSSGAIEGPLPVELTTFQAIAGDGQVTLHWRTESELDNDHFVLYKHKAGEEDFRMLAEIPGHGTTTEPHDYQYMDRFVQNGMTYEYRISEVDITGRETIHKQTVSATPTHEAMPLEFALYPNYPNPFNPTTAIRYDVKETGLVSLKVFDLLGREVATLVNREMPAGSRTIVWDATDLPSGVYLCRMEAERFVGTRKMMLLK